MSFHISDDEMDSTAWRYGYEAGRKAALAAQQDVGAAGKFELGDVVEMAEGATYYNDWRGIRLKIVGLRVDPDGKQWVCGIEGNPRHRGCGVYDSETTDIDAAQLRRVEQSQEKT